MTHPIICFHDHVVGDVAPAAPALAPVEAVSVFLAVDLDAVALIKGQLLLTGVGVRRHGGRIVVEKRHEPAHAARTLRRRPRPPTPVLVAGAAAVESGIAAAALAVVVALVVRRPLMAAAAAHVLLLGWRRRPTPLHVRAGAVVAAPLKVVLAVVLAVRVFGDFCASTTNGIKLFVSESTLNYLY